MAIWGGFIAVLFVLAWFGGWAGKAIAFVSLSIAIAWIVRLARDEDPAHAAKNHGDSGE